MGLKVLLLCLAILLPFTGCQSEKNTPVPDNLVGVWTTSAAKYANRFFEITKQSVRFGTGENIDIYPIAKIEISSIGNRSFYVISLRTPEGNPHRLAFHYDPHGEGTIQLENQNEIIWTKERSDQ